MSVPQNQAPIACSKLSGLGIFLLGLAGLIAALAMLWAAASSAGNPSAALSPSKAPLEAPPTSALGFELVQLGEFRRDHYLVNRDTGAIWNRVCSGEAKDDGCDGPLIWQEMCVEGKSSAACLMAESLSRTRPP